ncbi:MAG TPA: ParA family protein [Clostridiales bacterium]|nr:ParA family protein [Clostridiales bacterium]
MNLKQLTIIYGHYGCGKTNLSLNLALDCAKQGNRVTIVDLDIVNPYFRSSDYKTQLAEKGIDVICPSFAGTNLDTPALSPRIYSAFENKDSHIILDVGGDDAGAYALGRFRKNIQDYGDYSAYYIINKYRNFTTTPADAEQICSEIVSACGITPTGVINNSHLQSLTTVDDVQKAYSYGEETAKLLGVPLTATTAPKNIADSVVGDNIFPVDIIVKPPF